jgi:hypothetical protein
VARAARHCAPRARGAGRARLPGPVRQQPRRALRRDRRRVARRLHPLDGRGRRRPHSPRASARGRRSAFSRMEGTFFSPFGESESSSRRVNAQVQADVALASRARPVGRPRPACGTRRQHVHHGGDIPADPGRTHCGRLLRRGAVARRRPAVRHRRPARGRHPPSRARGAPTSSRRARPCRATRSCRSTRGSRRPGSSRRSPRTTRRLRAAAGTGIRPPDGFELAFTDNPSLRPERSLSAEAGVEQALAGGRVVLEATLFANAVRRPHRRGRVVRGVEPLPHRQHLERARPGARAVGGCPHQARRPHADRCRGAGRLHIAPPRCWRWTTGARRRRRSRSAIRCCAGRATSSRSTSGSRPDASRRSRAAAAAAARSTSSRTGALSAGFRESAGYQVWHAGAAWRLTPRLELFGRVTNLFDRTYEEAFGFPALGRGASAGLRVAAGR